MYFYLKKCYNYAKEVIAVPTKISENELNNYGINLNHETMDNGQLRFRLSGSDGSGYIRCENPGEPAWENSHSHSRFRELILVQRGTVVFASYIGGQAHFTALKEGEFIIAYPGIAHNEILSKDAVIHTVKHGDCSNIDWVPCPELDELTKHLTFKEALEAGGNA
ncbi:MAG: hypothetical protein IJF40_07555 [Clostridia bacterium]|nr:hypothetical protein [Clostridia bacterium]